MRKSRARWLGVALLTVLLTAAAARADKWQLDPAHSTIEFTVRHLMISNVRGHFDKFSGEVTADGQDPNSVKITATIDAASINTGVERRDGHLKSADFLEVEKFPTLTFVSKKIESAGEGKWKVNGDLTLHGVTKEVELDIDGPTPIMKDPQGKSRVGASATATINRKEFGVNWNKALEAGGVVVGDKVAVSIEVEAFKVE